MTDIELHRAQAISEKLDLKGRYRLWLPAAYTECNGIGQDWMPRWTRILLTFLLPRISIAAYIHDLDYWAGGNFGVIVRYGDLLTVCARENTEVEMDGGFQFDGSETTGAGTSTNGSVRMTIGPQITGYYVDAIKAGAKPGELAKGH